MSMDYKSLCKRNKLKRTAKPSTSIGKRTAYKYFQIRYNMEDKNDRTVLIYGNDEKVNPKYATYNKCKAWPTRVWTKYEITDSKQSVQAYVLMQLNG